MSVDLALAPKIEPSHSPTRALRVGLLGCGVVGSAVARNLIERSSELRDAAGASLRLERVAVRHLGKRRSIHLPPGLLTDNAHSVVTDPDIDLVVEVVGGVEVPRSLILTALRSGKSVVTANKELLGSWGGELAVVAAGAGLELRYEAASCGAIPIVRVLGESLRGDRVERFAGIVNGTCNFILTRMEQRGCTLNEALAEAQELGYAEADPSADIEGRDAAAKAALLANLAFGVLLGSADVDAVGISGLSRQDIEIARELGFAVRLLAEANRERNGIGVRVEPCLIPLTHPLAQLDGADNAIEIEAVAAGKLFFRGRGAGGEATASAVLGDLVEVARRRLGRGSNQPSPVPPPGNVYSERCCSYLLRLEPGAAGADRRLRSVLHRHRIGVCLSRDDRKAGPAGTWVLTDRTRSTVLGSALQQLAGIGLAPISALPVAQL